MSIGTQISDMTVSATLPSGSYVPFIVPSVIAGLSPAENYIYDAGAAFTARPTFQRLALNTGADLVGSNDNSSGTLWTTVGGFISYVLSSAGSTVVNFLQAGTGAVPRTVQSKLRDTLSLKDFGAVGDGVTDDTTAVQNAVNAAMVLGMMLLCPAGTYLLSSTINYITNNWLPSPLNAFAPGLNMIGEGIGKTTFLSSASGPIFNIDVNTAHSSFNATIGTTFEGMTIGKSGSPSGQSGIHLRAAFSVMLRQVAIEGLAGTGVKVQCSVGDVDGSNRIILDQVEIRNCTGWGLDAAADSGFNEISFIYLRETNIEGCGTSAVGVPTSGGIKWKGQILTLDTSGVGVNQNCGLYIPGDSGLANTLQLRNTTFENNYLRHIYCTGISGFSAQNIQLYSNDTHVVTTAVELDGASFQISQVEIAAAIVRATSGNSAYTAFKASGANADLNSIRVRNTEWQDFDFAGQTRFNGIRFPQVAQCCEIADSGATTSVLFEPVAGRGNSTPLRLRGPRNDGGVGVASTSGEWIEYDLTSARVLMSAGLTPNTTYNVYLYDAGGVLTLAASTTAYALDTASGYYVMSGDATMLFVGRVRTSGVAGGEFVRANVGWVNPAPFPGTQNGTDGWTWRDSGTNRIYFKDSVTLPTSVSDGQYTALT